MSLIDTGVRESCNCYVIQIRRQLVAFVFGDVIDLILLSLQVAEIILVDNVASTQKPSVERM
jgi:hypothetical protein